MAALRVQGRRRGRPDDQPSEFLLSYEVIKPEGSVRAEVHGEGRAKMHIFEDSVPLTGEAVAARLTWRTDATIPPTMEARVSLQLGNVRVYAYEVRAEGSIQEVSL